MLKKMGGQMRMIHGLRYWGVGVDVEPDTDDFY
jgi:hypothetical protein